MKNVQVDSVDNSKQQSELNQNYASKCNQSKKMI